MGGRRCIPALVDGTEAVTPAAAILAVEAVGTSIQDGARALSADRTMLVGSATRTTKCTAATTMGTSSSARRAAREIGAAKAECQALLQEKAEFFRDEAAALAVSSSSCTLT